jgi:hypothetical protein
MAREGRAPGVSQNPPRRDGAERVVPPLRGLVDAPR